MIRELLAFRLARPWWLCRVCGHFYDGDREHCVNCDARRDHTAADIYRDAERLPATVFVPPSLTSRRRSEQLLERGLIRIVRLQGRKRDLARGASEAR